MVRNVVDLNLLDPYIGRKLAPGVFRLLFTQTSHLRIEGRTIFDVLNLVRAVKNKAVQIKTME